ADDAQAQDILLAVQTNSKIDNEDRLTARRSACEIPFLSITELLTEETVYKILELF
ncbi:MAG: hypothetical protein UW74_C0010G0001, partial [Candidatus Giovannonibacteria bacterium GW2011_GWC2_44_8]